MRVPGLTRRHVVILSIPTAGETLPKTDPSCARCAIRTATNSDLRISRRAFSAACDNKQR